MKAPTILTAAVVTVSSTFTSACESVTEGHGYVCHENLPSAAEARRVSEPDRDEGAVEREREERVCVEPVESARVRVDCPGDHNIDWPRARTAASGTFDYTSIPAVPIDCDFVIRKQGFERLRIPVASICERRFFGECAEFELRAVLDPD